MKTPDIDAVSSLLDEVSSELILPRFRRLQQEDIQQKATPVDPDDIVTVVDREVEARLTEALTAMLPGSAVIGEEAAHERPELIERAASEDPMWILDPLDGTRNFAGGDESFGVMLGWAIGGRARAAWVLLPARRELFVAESGSGARRNGEAIGLVPVPELAMPRGIFLTRYMPEALASRVRAATRDRFVPGRQSHCAAIEYADVVQGVNDFVVYYRLMPWDHAAPALLLEESGGSVRHTDGSVYTLRSRNRLTIVARDAGVSARVSGWLSGLEPENPSDSARDGAG